jgi:hypothetical protein
VFHPGHEELHGITVVVETRGPATYVGRYDHQDQQGVHLLNVGVHDSGSGTTREDYLARCLKFGIKAEHRALTIATDEVARISQLVAWEQALPNR